MQQYGAAPAPPGPQTAWDIARKALEKLGDSSGEAGSSAEGSGKESKTSPEKKKVDGENKSAKQKDPTPQEAPDFMSQQHQNQMNMYGRSLDNFSGNIVCQDWPPFCFGPFFINDLGLGFM